MDSGPGHFPGNRRLLGGADGLRQSLGPETLQQPPFPARAQPGQGRGASRQAGGSRDATVTAAGQGAWPWGRLESKPQQPECLSAGTRGAAETGCLVPTSPQSSRAPGRNHAATQGQVFCLEIGPGHLPTPHTPGACPVPVPPASAFASHQLEAAGGCERSQEADARSTHTGTLTTRWVERTQREARTPSLREAGSTGKGTGHSGRGLATLKHTWLSPWLANSHAARKEKQRLIFSQKGQWYRPGTEWN